MHCPVDQTELSQSKHEGVTVDRCPTCQGLWLEKGELERIQASHEKDYSGELKAVPDYVSQAYAMARLSAEAQYACPKCGEAMEKREHGYCSQVMIDVCPACRGVWLHEGELTALELFFERSHVQTEEIRHGYFGSLLMSVR